MAKFINADKFKKDNDWLLDCDFPNKTEETLEELIDNAPAADVVEVVRCKDCKHRYVGGYTTQYYICDFMDAELKDEGYCSYGEREDG